MSRVAGRRRSASEWQSLIEDLENGGEDAAEFCRRRGLRLSTLQWWRWRLRTERGSASVACRPAVTAAAVEFAEVRLSGREVFGAETDSFELRWSDGLTLRIPARFEEGSLRRLLAVLDGGPC
jgi:transposase-like protein